jgi:thiamine biosynthesis lipoprotein
VTLRRLLITAALCVYVATACSPASGDSERAPPAPVATPPAPTPPALSPPKEPAAAPGDRDYSQAANLMGTVIRVTVAGATRDQAKPAIDAAFAEVKRLESLLSEWIPTSEISRINAAAGQDAVSVSGETIDVIEAANAISRWSSGAFDLTWAALRGMYLFQPDNQQVPELSAIKERLKLIDYRKIKVDVEAGTVKLDKKGMVLGTGGIAKGYALDKAADILREAGFANFMIFGGGQIELSGTRHGRPWRVGIQHPRANDYFGFVEATDGSVATAGDYEHSFVKDGKRWHHIIDTKTGLPVPHTSSVTVVADSGLAADAIDTAIFILGAKRALKMMKTAPFAADAVIVDSDMRVHMTPGMEKRIVMRASLTDGKLPMPPSP